MYAAVMQARQKEPWATAVAGTGLGSFHRGVELHCPGPLCCCSWLYWLLHGAVAEDVRGAQ
jgi:hypothetical protein